MVLRISILFIYTVRSRCLERQVTSGLKRRHMLLNMDCRYDFFSRFTWSKTMNGIIELEFGEKRSLAFVV